VTGGLNLLDDLCAPGLNPAQLTVRPLKFLVVDDDWISRQALSQALQKAFSPPDLCADGASALLRLGEHAYDVIFLDVQMPEMDGFELCLKIRETPLNRATPVIFVTSQSDFDARAKSTLSSGTELMGKPFLTFEVTVKALTLAFSGRLHERDLKPLAAPEPGRDKAKSLLNEPTPASAVTRHRPPTNSAAAPVDDLNTAFLTRTSVHLPPLRELCQKIVRTENEEARQTLLADVFLRINSLTANSLPALNHPAYQFSSALEGLFRKLLENSKYSTVSTAATIAGAVELLPDLCVPGLPADFMTQPAIRLLVVDDDLVARRALTGALQTVFEKPESVESGEAALALAADKPFDLIFLDVVMPGLDGFAVCERLRDTIPNRATPVVFVTSHDDAAARERMQRSGGSGLLGKPFLTAEITVKALTVALRGRLKQRHPQPLA
jgi:CheY-like chemotaxis protein